MKLVAKILLSETSHIGPATGALGQSDTPEIPELVAPARKRKQNKNKGGRDTKKIKFPGEICWICRKMFSGKIVGDLMGMERWKTFCVLEKIFFGEGDQKYFAEELRVDQKVVAEN
ncbi:hypothetical protein FXO37_12183 [Capsicum annuum]|nr:hypothetical protein FXO37_12183 [Capsicum annuum]